MIALGAAASVVAAGLVIALVAVVGASSGPAATTNGEATHQSLRIAAQSPDTTGTLQLGDVTAGLSHSSLRADLTAPGGPTVTPDIALGVEPGAAVDGLVSGQVAVHTPTIASVRSIGVNLGAEGKITTTVHQWAGILSTHP